MANHLRTAAGLAALAFLGVASSYAAPEAKPVYTFCEEEDNDLCSSPDIIDASEAVASLGGDESQRDCFYITGKLQEDCIWDIEPNCALRVYDKPAQCRDTSGNIIPGAFYEPIIRSGKGVLSNVPVLSDRTVRIGVAANPDAFDGTINGLNNNGAHREVGEVTVKVTWTTGDDGQPRGGGENYVFTFVNGSDAGRFAVVVPPGVTTVNIECCDDTGTQEVCYDVDHYLIRNLIPSAAYSIEVIGGLDHDCRKTDTLIGWFDKNCLLHATDDDSGTGVYSHLFVFAEVDGTLRFAVTGSGDEDFNGLEDRKQQDYFRFLQRLWILDNFIVDYRQGASLCCDDGSAGDVTRYPRQLWDSYHFLNEFYGAPEGYFDHDVCGDYTIKVSLAQHIDPGNRPSFPPLVILNGARADVNGDGFVNASDLALMLSFWGQPVQ